MQVLSDVIGGLFRLVLRLTLLVAGAVFFMSLLVAGIVVAGAYTLWSLLRGRRPTLQDILRFQRGRAGWSAGFGTRARPGHHHGHRPTSGGDVVEVQAREVTRAVQ
ncbi:hypothetical protein [Sphaerotilus sp.]|uniref:hypothetical protein n=1 Tax=Sphaerotilus sp. TaxID=2093942 RepID=UPI002ACD3D9E|nr:hypothetical protein [Sphaerotilus sp.]MDZ7857676.1 hypothetical protein [Sphaerotilus sp.]